MKRGGRALNSQYPVSTFNIEIEHKNPFIDILFLEMYRKYTAFITYSLETETLETIGALSWPDPG